MHLIIMSSYKGGQMKILTYDDILVDKKWGTPNPGSLLRFAMDITMKKDANPYGMVSSKTIKFLFDAEHTEPIEHCVICFYIQDMSKSCLGQITRHRISSKTSASQHYQFYSEYPHVVEEALVYDEEIDNFFEQAELLYQKKISEGHPKEEARQVLPNAKAGNLLITINASSLYNFFRKRMCNRNCKEIQVLAEKMWAVTSIWWPEFAHVCGPPCFLGKCNQGYMMCDKPYIHPLEKIMK